MIELSPFAERIVDRMNMIGMWLAVVICARNFHVSLKQYRRTRGKIHLVNLGQISVFFIHRFLFGLIPLFEITTCAFFPLLISLWHIDYLLFYTVMFMRLVIIETERHSKWIKCVGVFFIALRFADWPYELSYFNVQKNNMSQQVPTGVTCLTEWVTGVLILNFISDSLANLFLSGMFVRRLYKHIQRSRSVMSQQNSLIEYIARKSLICLILAFVANFAMNLLKVTEFLGDRTDSFTVYFEIVESTLLVEALRADAVRPANTSMCDNCGMALQMPHDSNEANLGRPDKPATNDGSQPSQHNACQRVDGVSISGDQCPLESDKAYQLSLQYNPFVYKDDTVNSTVSAPTFALTNRPKQASSRSPIKQKNTKMSLETTSFSTDGPRRLADNREWNNNDYRMF
ncbi:hypothetical protein CLU79DRAFT_735610 [Phycomyces nitens]|nr:hypothetical protein CLU79DRAFT_735610 [Phycomyces nitens]